jgi:beta-galactosidase
MNHAGLILCLMLFSADAGKATTVSRDKVAAETINLDQSDGGSARSTKSLDSDWRFLDADVPGAEKPEFDDSAWRIVNVPHDWSIEGSFDQKNPTGSGGGYLPAGVGWYRKQFFLKKHNRLSDRESISLSFTRIYILFDGIMANSDVWVNGFHLGKHPYGYVSFSYDLTDHLHVGKEPNVLAVRVDNSLQPASRWYTGAGIYRHVHLVSTNALHIDQYGVFVNTSMISPAHDKAVIHARITVVNPTNLPQPILIKYELYDPDSKQTRNLDYTNNQSIRINKSAEYNLDITVENPKLWDLDHPNLYRLKIICYEHFSTNVHSEDVVNDIVDCYFGIRETKFEPETGFWLNDKNIKIKGVCLHQDAGGLGTAVPERAWERRFAILKQLGCNAVRTAHNPPSPEFLDAADRMGMLVMDEMFDCWTAGKNKGDYHLFFKEWSEIDTRDTVRRDRNHPSVILYSAGNEIHDTPKPDLAKGILKSLVDVFHQNDPTRPVTQGLFRPNQSGDYTNGLADMLDVIGTNYRNSELLAAWQAKPTRKIINTEDKHDRSAWLLVRDNPALAGQFLWTGFDYLGEAFWPNIAWGESLVDRTGVIRPMGYERQSWWAEQPVVHIARIESTAGVRGAKGGSQRLCDWTPRDPANYKEANIEVYSNCQQVELILNDKSLGSKPRAADDAPRTWRVPYEPGTIKALGKNGDKVVATDELRTAGKPAKIVLTADRDKLPAGLSDSFENISYVTAAVADENGVTIPWADDLISFKISGILATIVAVDNGDIASHEPFQASERHAYQGRCVAIIRTDTTSTPDKAILTASSPGLTGGSITINTR